MSAPVMPVDTLRAQMLEQFVEINTLRLSVLRQELDDVKAENIALNAEISALIAALKLKRSVDVDGRPIFHDPKDNVD